MSNIVKLGIQFILLFSMIAYYCLYQNFTIHITVAWLLIPVLILMLALLGLGTGIIISALTTKYRDFNVLLTFAVQLLMYLTPIAYPLSYISKTKYSGIVRHNPVTSVVETFKHILFNTGGIEWSGLLYTTVIIVIILFL